MHATPGTIPQPRPREGFDLPLDQERIFSDHKGRHRKSIEKRQSRLLRKLPPLNRLLEQDEHIVVVTTGCTPTSLLEQWLTGWAFVYIKRAILVFTNKRIIHIPTRRNYSYRNSLAEIRYEDCRSIKLRWGALTVKYKNDKKETFLYIAGKERRKIKALLNKTVFHGEPSSDPRRRHLCPRCTGRLKKAVYVCPHCRLGFKSREEARKLAVLLPGGGYFYTRHPFLGIADAVVEVALIAVMVDLFLEYFDGVEGAAAGLIFVSVALIFEKLVSVYHSNHFVEEYITEEKQPVYLSTDAAG